MIKFIVPCLMACPLMLGACANMSDGPDAVSDAAPQSATAALVDSDGSPRGIARAVASGDGLRITIEGENLSPGSHGAHVHMTGACTPPDFASAGGHWNPTGRQHGRNNPQGMHLGDLPNLMIGTDGRGMIEITVPGAQITGDANALLDQDGAALVIHAGPDDMVTDPSGNSGGRIACGVFAAS